MDNVNHPSHYETGQFECIDVMVETQGVEAIDTMPIEDEEDENAFRRAR